MVKHARVAPIFEYIPLHITTPGTLVPVGLCVSTTSSITITAGSGVVVTPASMTGIYLGQILNIANGTGSAEDVTVTGITSTTFTASFINNHSGAYTIISRRGTDLGRVTVNSAGNLATLTLYNGHPGMLPDAGGSIAVIDCSEVTPFEYGCTCDKGLFYTLAVSGGGTNPDLTLMYLDHAN